FLRIRPVSCRRSRPTRSVFSFPGHAPSLTEHFDEMGHQTILYFSRVNLTAKQARKRSHSATGYPAGHDQIEIREIRRHVQRESVAGHPACDADSDRGELVWSDPHPRQPLRACGHDVVIGGNPNEHLLEIAD